MASDKEQLGEIASNLLNLEINTIVKQDMTATKMPPARHALMDIGKSYRQALQDIDRRYDAVLTEINAGAGLGDYDSGETPHGSQDYFDRYRIEANRRMKELQGALTGLSPDEDERWSRDRLMLTRIQDTSDQLKAILRRAGDANDYTRKDVEGLEPSVQAPERLEAKLTAEDLATIRKAWEITTEQIVFQTVIQIDGDVITRVASDTELSQSSHLLEIHNTGVKFSISFWGQLISLVTNALSGLIPRIGLR